MNSKQKASRLIAKEGRAAAATRNGSTVPAGILDAAELVMVEFDERGALRGL